MLKKTLYIIILVLILSSIDNKIFAEGEVNSDKNNLLFISDIKDIQMGEGFCLILTTKGDLYGVGKNNKNQLGTDDKIYYDNPIKIMNNVNMISCGFNHSLVITKDKTLYSFGDNSFHQLGISDTNLQGRKVKLMKNVDLCSAGATHSFVLKDDGTLYGFGNNLYHQLSDSNLHQYKFPTVLMTGVKKVDSGFLTSVVKKKDDSTTLFGSFYKSENNKHLKDKLNSKIDAVYFTINNQDTIYYLNSINNICKIGVEYRENKLIQNNPIVIAKNVTYGEKFNFKDIEIQLNKKFNIRDIYMKIGALLNKNFSWQLYKKIIHFSKKPDINLYNAQIKILNKIKDSSKENIIKKDDKLIAISFDDGPSKYTEDLLNKLYKYDARATFFVLGANANKHRNIIKRIVTEGHEIGNHTYSHPDLRKYSKKVILNEIDSCDKVIEDTIGIKPTLLRPPYGAYNDFVLSLLKSRNKSAIMWNVDTLDWKYRNVDYVKNYLLNHVKDGDLVLLHDIHKTSVEGFKQALPELLNRGFKLVTVSELMNIRNYKRQNGRVYFKFLNK